MRIRKQEPANKDKTLSNEEILAAAKMADALAHPARIRMLKYILAENIARRSVTNKDLVKVFDYAQATISQHLSKLIIGGLLEVRKRRTSSYYYVLIGKLSTFTEILKRIDPANEGDELPDFLKNIPRTGGKSSEEIDEGMSTNYFDGDQENDFDV